MEANTFVQISVTACHTFSGVCPNCGVCNKPDFCLHCGICKNCGKFHNYPIYVPPYNPWINPYYPNTPWYPTITWSNTSSPDVEFTF